MINKTRVYFFLIFFACLFTGNEFSAQKINQFDKNKKRTGVWMKYYPNKKIRYKGQFENGKEVGVFKFYDISDSSKPNAIKVFSKTNDSVSVSFFSIKGNLKSKGFFLDKKRVGLWKYFFADGKMMSKEFYVSGNLQGELINYYPNGKPAEISNYRDGLKNGVSQKYSSDGILIEEVAFKNGKANGLAKYFELSGNLKEKGIYKNGKRIGKWEFYLDGEIAENIAAKKKKTFSKQKQKDKK